ncbi:MAG: hypothetical protein R3C05_03055 [Pirellulaceae bacterium]
MFASAPLLVAGYRDVGIVRVFIVLIRDVIAIRGERIVPRHQDRPVVGGSPGGGFAIVVGWGGFLLAAAWSGQ